MTGTATERVTVRRRGHRWAVTCPGCRSTAEYELSWPLTLSLADGHARSCRRYLITHRDGCLCIVDGMPWPACPRCDGTGQTARRTRRGGVS